MLCCTKLHWHPIISFKIVAEISWDFSVCGRLINQGQLYSVFSDERDKPTNLFTSAKDTVITLVKNVWSPGDEGEQKGKPMMTG